MPPMPDAHAEAGHILTHLSYGMSGPSRSPLPTQFQTSNQNPHHPSASSLTPIAELSKPPELSPPAKRSRSRPTKSCEQCRKKKLKCNRELPCSQCLKGGRDGRTCHFEYGPEAGEKDPERGDGMERGLKRFRIDVEDQRRNSLQITGPRESNSSMGYTAPSYPPRQEVYSPYTQAPMIPGRPQGFFSNYATPPTPESVPSSAPSATASAPAQAQKVYTSSALGRIHAKGFGSRYVGYSDKMAMLDHFEDCKSFIMECFHDPEMSGTFQELSAYQRAFYPKHGHHGKHNSPDPIDDLPHDRKALLAEMLLSVPSTYDLASLKEKYITTWETVSRILHIPTFIKDCAALTAAKAAGALTLPSHIQDWTVAQVLCVISIASRLNESIDKTLLAEKRSEEQISRDLAMVQKWFNGIRGKAQLNGRILETRVLLLVAHHVNIAHPGALWNESGDVVRRAMTMGLHLDPESSDRLSKASKEMRRKLWTTIIELDIRFSLGASMPCAIPSSLININEILNVDDDELMEDMEQYPLHKPTTIWTQALPQIALAASMKQRLEVTNMLGGCLNIEHDAPVLLQHAKALEKELRSLPTQFRSSTKAGNISNKQVHRLFTSIMLDVSIRRPILALYRAIALSSSASRYPEAMAGALRTSLAILAHLDALDPQVADLSTVKSRDYLNLFHILCKNDIMQAAMVLCYQIRSFNINSRTPEPTEDESINDQEIFHEGYTKQSLTRVVENTLKSMIQRIGEFGSDLKEVLPLSVLLYSVRTDGIGTEKKELMIKGAERVLLACRQLPSDIQEVARQNMLKCRRGPGGRRCKEGIPRSPATAPEAWSTGSLPVHDVESEGNRQLPTFEEFNLMAGDDLLSLNFDFGFSDWDMTQNWA